MIAWSFKMDSSEDMGKYYKSMKVKCEDYEGSMKVD